MSRAHPHDTSYLGSSLRPVLHYLAGVALTLQNTPTVNSAIRRLPPPSRHPVSRCCPWPLPHKSRANPRSKLPARFPCPVCWPLVIPQPHHIRTTPLLPATANRLHRLRPLPQSRDYFTINSPIPTLHATASTNSSMSSRGTADLPATDPRPRTRFPPPAAVLRWLLPTID